MPGVIAAIQTFGERINIHPHLHFLVTEGGVDEAGVFHKIPRIDDWRLAELFAREVLADLIRKELLSAEWAERILAWRHTGFSVHSRVRARTKEEAERVGQYMIRPLLSLQRLSLDEKEGKVCYRYGKDPQEVDQMDYLDFIARVTSHIPDKGQVTVRYYGLYANAHRGKIKKASLAAFPLRIVEDKLRPIPAKGWAEMIRKVYEVDPLLCPECGGQMKVIAFLTDYSVVDRIIKHLKLTFVAERPRRLGLPSRNISWPLRPPRNIFRDSLFDREESSVGFRALLAPGPFPPTHPCSPKPSLTVFDLLIYASSRWLDGIIESKMRPRPAQLKSKFL
jgi:hypothetical protein